MSVSVGGPRLLMFLLVLPTLQSRLYAIAHVVIIGITILVFFNKCSMYGFFLPLSLSIYVCVAVFSCVCSICFVVAFVVEPLVLVLSLVSLLAVPAAASFH